MMKYKRYIVFFLFLISLIMLAVPAIPHHHHTNNVICMKKDIPTDAPCPTHYHHSGNDTCCSDECLTKFYSPTLSGHIDNAPHYVFITTLFTHVIVAHLFKPQEKRVKEYCAYRETLHSTVISRASGPRAPPPAAKA